MLQQDVVVLDGPHRYGRPDVAGDCPLEQGGVLLAVYLHLRVADDCDVLADRGRRLRAHNLQEGLRRDVDEKPVHMATLH